MGSRHLAFSTLPLVLETSQMPVAFFCPQPLSYSCVWALPVLLMVTELSVSSEPKHLWSLHSLTTTTLECSQLFRDGEPKKSPLFCCPHCLELLLIKLGWHFPK